MSGETPDFEKPPAVPTKLVHKAVRASDLCSDSRHIMHVLALIADYQTSELPPQHTPSSGQLARETGLSKSTVIRRRNELEEAGWIVLQRPTPEESVRHVRIKYYLAIPAVGAHRVHAEAAERLAQNLTDSGTGDPGDSRYQGDPSRGFTVNPPDRSVWIPGGVTQTPAGVSGSDPEASTGVSATPHGVSDSHPAGCQPDTSNTYLPDYLDLQKPPAAAGGREERFAAAEDLFEGFVREHGTKYAQRHPAIRAVIITAVADNGVPRNDAAKALHRLALAGRQITPDSLTQALARLRGPDPARAAEPPPAPPKPPRRLCPIHPAVELTEHGLCTGCAGDAKAGRDDLDLDEPLDPAHIPTPRRALYAVPPTDHESRSA